MVDCSFVTDFDNHIFVTTDAEAIYFIHDLITSYIKQKEIVLNHQKQTSLGIKPKEPIIGPKEPPVPDGGTSSDAGVAGGTKNKVDPLQV